MNNMDCPKCKSEMEKGMLTGDSRHWIKDNSAVGSLNKMVNPGFGKPNVWAYRCNQCKKIEFISD